MDDLRKALSDISSMRRQMARSTEFRGYGPATLAGTAGFALLAAGIQTALIPDPATQVGTFLSIWIWTALASAVLIGVQMHTRSRRMHSGLADEMIRMAVEQFLPSALAGSLVTVVLVRYSPSTTWLLPGLWQIVFSLGVFSSCRFLPRAMVVAGVWYLATGLFCLSVGDARALSPWAMGIPYGIGQFIVAAVLCLSSKDNADEL
jgi:hypothetical protein